METNGSQQEFMLHSKKVSLPDGRYLVYFTFGDDDADPGDMNMADPCTPAADKPEH